MSVMFFLGANKTVKIKKKPLNLQKHNLNRGVQEKFLKRALNPVSESKLELIKE